MSGDTVKCASCENEVPFHARSCPVCQNDVGFPNVRAAENEETELENRYFEALASAKSGGSEDAVGRFDTALNSSNAVICRSLKSIIGFLQSENELYTSFYKQIGQSSRVAEYNQWDRGRESVDGILFPLYRDNIIFAALSLSDYGVSYYGNCHLVLSPEVIAHRSSAFEENPFLFCKRHGVIAGQPVPTGFRSTWENRHMLGVAKLQHNIDSSTSDDDFPGILISENSGEPDFVEIHVYGQFTAKQSKR